MPNPNPQLSLLKTMIANTESTTAGAAVSAAFAPIDTAAKNYAAARRLLAERAATFEREVRAISVRLSPGIKTALAHAEDAQAKLTAAIQASPELFEKPAPRTVSLHGIKLGMKKGVGAIDWADDEKLAAQIKKILRPRFDELVKTTHKPLAAALKLVDVATLKKLGCSVTAAGDFVFVKADDSALDKLVARILSEGSVEEAEAPKA